MAKRPIGFQTNKPDPDELLAYVTGDGLSAEEREVARRERRNWGRLQRYLLEGTPDALTTTLRSRSASTSSAHGFVYVRDQEYYDAIDEVLEKDPDILPAFELFSSLALRRGWELLPAKHGKEDKRANELRDLVEERVLEVESDCFGFDHLIDMLPTYRLAHGISVCEILWEVRDGRYEPIGYPHRHPGQFASDPAGRLLLFDTAGQTSGIGIVDEVRPLPDRKFVALRTGAKYGNPYGRSLVEALKYVYEIKRLVLRSWVNFARNHGTPLGVGRVTAQGLGSGTDENRLQVLLEELKSVMKALGESSGVVLRPEQELTFEDRGRSNSGETVHERLYRFAQRQTYRIVFGSILHIMEAEFGTRAQASEHGDVAEIRARPLAEKLAGAINRGLILPYLEINEGPEAVELAPVLQFDTDDDVVVDEAIRILETAQKLKIPTSVEQAREWLGLRAPEDDEDTIEIVEQQPAQNGLGGLGIPGLEGLLRGAGREGSRSGRKGAGDGQGKGASKEGEDEDDDDEDEGDEDAATKASEPPSGGGSSVQFAEGSPVGIEDRTRSLIDRIATQIAAVGSLAVREEFLGMFGFFKQATAGVQEGDTLAPSALTMLVPEKVLPGDGGATEEIYHALMGSRLLARLGALHQLEAAGVGPAASGAFRDRPKGAAVGFDEGLPEELLTQTPAELQATLVWLKANKLLSDSELRDIVLAMQDIPWPEDPALLANVVREEARKLAGAINVQVSDRIRATVVRAVDQGMTHAEFLDAMDEIIETGGLPGASEAYLENVFRTECAQTYTQQQDAVLATPAVDVFLWGYQFFNPKDGRSRDSHAAMSNKIIQKGSAADRASRPGPPWSYQCRCVRAPLFVGDPENPGYEESPGALSAALALERF